MRSNNLCNSIGGSEKGKAMDANSFKKRLNDGELLLGTHLTAPNPKLAALCCQANIDFLWIDTEHDPYASESLGLVPVLARQSGVAPVVRVAWNDPALIKKAYDVGAVAVMVPQIETAEEAARAVEYAFYPPKGNRGVAPNWPTLAVVNTTEVIKSVNEQTALILQIESVKAYENLDEIASVPGIDALFVGPMDLSATLGIVTDVHDPSVQKIMRDVPYRLEGTGIATGTTLPDVDDVRCKIEWGYRFINVGDPVNYGIETLNHHLETLR